MAVGVPLAVEFSTNLQLAMTRHESGMLLHEREHQLLGSLFPCGTR